MRSALTGQVRLLIGHGYSRTQGLAAATVAAVPGNCRWLKARGQQATLRSKGSRYYTEFYS